MPQSLQAAEPAPAEEAEMPRFSRNGAAPPRPPLRDDDNVTVAVFEEAMGMALDRLDEHKADQAAAMAAAIRSVLEDKEVAKKFVTNAREALADSAIQATGRGIWRAIGGIAEKWWLVLLLGLFTLHTMGWGPAVAFVKFAFGGGRPA